MQTQSKGLEWEIQWIRKNVDQYDSVLHSESVIQNIIKRYALAELKRYINELIKELESEM